MRDDAPLPVGMRAAQLRRRASLLVALMVLATTGYLGTLSTIEFATAPQERSFGTGPGTPERVKVYLEPLSVDPVDESMQIRVDVAPDTGLRGARPDAPNRDLTLMLTTDEGVEVRAFRANEPMAPTEIRADLAEGTVSRYPLDRYRIPLRVQAFEGLNANPETAHPTAEEVTVWEGLLGYRIRARQVARSNLGDIGLNFDLRRAAAHIFFALAAYGAMIVLACSALGISSLTFLGYRSAEATLVGALAALVFALPVLRGTMPGSPPLGVWGDVAVFLWAELAAVLGVALMVLSWARREH